MAEHTGLGQIIDDGGEFTPAFGALATSWKLATLADSYAVVAVLGCQSSGKSTLLNLLFDTPFAVMDASRGRTQTTQGLWLSRDAEAPDWLVLDVEGNDSRERGEDHTAFERKTALFSLALADVLIVNMWCTDFGRWDAANLGILKTVFACDVQLFLSGDTPRKLLYFVVRDYDADTPQDALRDIICTDVSKIWDSIAKPDQFANASLDTFFKLDFVFLPHYKHCRADFTTEVAKLRSTFHQRDADGVYTLSARGNRVLAGDLPVYAEQIWATIAANKDLNLPSEREMLAMYRCESISADALAAADPAFAALDGSFSGPTVAPILADALASFDAEAKLYHAGVVAEARAKLQEALLARAAPLFEAAMADASTTGLAAATDAFGAALPTTRAALNDALGRDPPFSFAAVAATAEEAACATVQALTALADPDAWPAVPFVDPPTPVVAAPRVAAQHATEVARVIAGARTAFVELVVAAVTDDAKEYLEEECELHAVLRSGAPDLWARVRTLRDAAAAQSADAVAALGASLGPAEAEVDARVAAAIDAMVKSAVSEFVRVLPLALRQTFDDHFKFGPDRLPIRWKPGDDIDARYRDAREAALGMLDAFASVELVVGAPEPLLSNMARRQLASQLENDLRAAYLDAQQQLEAVSIRSKVPTWVIPLVLVLGFNEFWMIVSNPFLLVLVLIVGGGATAAWFLGMLGPLRTFLLGDLRSVIERVFAAFDPPPTAGAGSASGTSGASGAGGASGTSGASGAGSSSTSKAKTE